MPTDSYRITIDVPEGYENPLTDLRISEMLIEALPWEGSTVTVTETRLLRVEGRQGPTGAWHYVEIGKNGEVTSTSENYSSRDACREQGTIKAHELGVPFVWEGMPPTG